MSIISTGFHDITASFKSPDLWWYLGWQDIKQRYRRSILGPWWVTISTGVLVLTLGLLWSQVFNVVIESYMPMFAIGLICWTFISGVLNEACIAFSQFEGIIKQRSTNFFSYILRIYIRHIVIFFHNFLIIFLVITIVGPGFSLVSLLMLPGLCLASLSILFIATPIAVFCTRFRDMHQIVASALQILFYVTPIIWEPSALKSYKWALHANPFFSVISLIRRPLLHEIPTTWDISMASGLALLGLGLSILTLGKFRNRIAYWL